MTSLGGDNRSPDRRDGSGEDFFFRVIWRLTDIRGQAFRTCLNRFVGLSTFFTQLQASRILAGRSVNMECQILRSQGGFGHLGETIIESDVPHAFWRQSHVSRSVALPTTTTLTLNHQSSFFARLARVPVHPTDLHSSSR
jgi:hypothetical protein